MIRTNNTGVITVKVIDPKSLANMDDNKIVIVNRVQISSKIVEYEIKNENNDNLMLLKHAFQDMKMREKGSKNIVIGAKMHVRDVRLVFPEYKSFPKNSFVFVDE